jgi:hypothetical protein
MSYAKYIDFGKDLNNNIKNPMNAANPLTYCMIPTLNSQFFHGSLSGGLLYGNENSNCMNFMAERCSKEWDGFCEAYLDINVDSYWPNQAVVDATAYNNAKNFFKFKPTIGQDLLRNACYRKFIYNPNSNPSYQQFDNTVPNSPLLTVYDNYVTGYSQIKNLSDPSKLDQDPHIQRMLKYPYVCFDVLGRIYLAYLRKENGINIRGTFLEKFFQENKKILNEFIQQAIIFVPSFQKENNSYCCT